MSTSSLEELVRTLNDLNQNYPRPHAQLELTPLVEVIPGTNAQWPSNGKPGVYIFMDENKKLTYIGKASTDIGLRLSARFDTKWRSKTTESSRCKYISTIPLHPTVGFEAPSIEEYLLMHLKTEFNRVHNG